MLCLPELPSSRFAEFIKGSDADHRFEFFTGRSNAVEEIGHRSEPLHFLQIWIQPRERGLIPSYTEWHPKPEHTDEPKVLVISPNGRDGSATIHQDAEIYRIRLQPGQTVKHELKPGRGAWLQIAEGVLTLNGVALATGDGASTEEPGTLKLSANAATEALLFDLG